MAGEANIWNPRTLLEVSADTKRVTQRFGATEGQTLFNITEFTYALGTGALAVYKNGDHLSDVEFAENTATSFSLVTPATAGDQIVAVGYVGITADVDVRDTDIFLTNYQQLRDYVGTEETIYIKGTTIAGDNGESFFQKKTGMAPGTYVDNNDTVIVPTGGDGSIGWIKGADTRTITHTQDSTNYNLALFLKDLALNLWTRNIMQDNASPSASGADNVTAINAALATGKHVIIPKGYTFDIDSGIQGSIEGQQIFGGGKLRATAAMTVMFEHVTARYQMITGEVELDGNGLADYCYKASFPKCGLSNARCENSQVYNAWLAYFSTFIDGKSKIINGNGGGILIQDGIGQVNDVRVDDSIVSGNATYGIRNNTSARDGIWLTKLNMENNCSQAGGYAHIFSLDMESLHIEDIYMENSLNTDATNTFFDFASGISTLTIKKVKMNDSASTTPFDYFFKIASVGGNLLRKGSMEDIWGSGYGSHLIQNNLDTGKNNYLSLKNINTVGHAVSTWLTSGTAIDLLTPVRSALGAKRVTTNMNFGTGGDPAIFNEAQDSTVQATVDQRLEPASYDLTTGRYTAFETGNYNASGIISVTAPPAGEYFTVTIMKDATAVHGPFYSQNGDGTKNVSCAFEGTVTCETGEDIWIELASSTGTMAMRLGGSNLSIEKVGTNYGQQVV